MFTTEMGDHLGRYLYPWLRKIDIQLATLSANLQRQGVKLKTNKRYVRLQTRIRAFVSNEINRVLNRLVKVYGPRSIIAEDLDFRYGGLSNKLNRILARAGRTTVRRKLVSIEETLGIVIHEVNPAYTSQQCSGCGYVDSQNRKGLRFVCRFCGKSLDADTNGARVISQRRSMGAACLGVSRQTVLQKLDEDFEARWHLPNGRSDMFRHPIVEQLAFSTPNCRRANRVLSCVGPRQGRNE